MADLAAAALAYAQRRISVFPLAPRSKAPMIANGFKQATTNVDQVRRWWRRRGDCNIGIATGAPAGFWVLDIDGEAAEGALAALEAQHGALPTTVQQTTGRGRHICFRWNPEGPEMRNRSKVGGADIDVRGNGGYIVAPPSIHPGDEQKGIPPGRVYGWSWGRSPDDIPFADAPAWLIDLCRPRDQVAPAAVQHPAPRLSANGRATRYGEVVLDACIREIVAAKKGARDSTLYRFACKAAGLVPGGHLEPSYLRGELERAGLVHVPDAMSAKQLERQIERAIAWGAAHAWGPELDRGARSAISDRRPHATPIQAALSRADGLALLQEALPDGDAVAQWLRRELMSPAGVPGGLEQLRVLPGLAGLVLPLRAGPGCEADGAALFGWRAGGQCTALRGLHEGRVGVLAWPPGADQVLVATNLVDAWALAEAAFESGDPMGVVVAPRLSTFAGAPLGDRWGRIEASTPRPDPDRAAWTWPKMRAVYLAVRRDLRGPELKARKFLGGTRRVALSSEFWGGLAAASWRAAGANAVRVLAPPAGRVGFSISEGA